MNLANVAARLVSILPWLRPWLSRKLINCAALATSPRPRPYSMWSEVQLTNPGDVGPVSDYTSWPSLTDRRFSGRHLPPADYAYIKKLPPNDSCDPSVRIPIGSVTALFKRSDMKKDRSSVLFPYFAQWFTDSFLRSDPTDRRKNTSNHEIDLCQIYGLTEETANTLRSKQGGKLSSQFIHGEEFPEYLYELDSTGELKPREKYRNLPYVANGQLDWILNQQNVPADRRAKIYATGLERGNSSIGYVAISTVFLREHNRLCRELQSRNPSWGDERLFQTARLINTAMLLRIVIEDYINHIAGAKIFLFDNSFAEDQNWYRTNWIAMEFDILYRWHGLVPDYVNVNGIQYTPQDFQNNNGLLENVGIEQLITAATKEQAGKIGLFNTPDFLLWADCMSIKMGRDYRLRSFNAYRERFGLKSINEWSDLTSDQQVQSALRTLYATVEDLEFIVGIFAEEPKNGALFGELLNTMVASDAFTQALTNPILSENIFNTETLTQFGLDEIGETSSLQSIVNRNVSHKIHASFDFIFPT